MLLPSRPPVEQRSHRSPGKQFPPATTTMVEPWGQLHLTTEGPPHRHTHAGRHERSHTAKKTRTLPKLAGLIRLLCECTYTLIARMIWLATRKPLATSSATRNRDLFGCFASLRLRAQFAILKMRNVVVELVQPRRSKASDTEGSKDLHSRRPLPITASSSGRTLYS